MRPVGLFFACQIHLGLKQSQRSSVALKKLVSKFLKAHSQTVKIRRGFACRKEKKRAEVFKTVMNSYLCSGF